MRKVLILALVMGLALSFGCAKKKTETAAAPAPAPKAEAPATKAEAKQPTPRELYEQMYAKLPTSYDVVKGDSLWKISKKDNIYADPFMWPLIYKANKDKIKNPNLIYPKQNFKIERALKLDDIKAARMKAGKSKKRSDPPATAKIPADVRAQLGYGF